MLNSLPQRARRLSACASSGVAKGGQPRVYALACLHTSNAVEPWRPVPTFDAYSARTFASSAYNSGLSSVVCRSTAGSNGKGVDPAGEPVASSARAASSLAGTSAAGVLTAPSATPLSPAAARVYSSAIQGNVELLKQLLHSPTAFATGHDILDSIVKVYTVHSRPNNFLPWQNHPKRESTGTGFVIHDRLILTNAHCIADATYVTVKRHGSGTRYRALVQAVGHDCDLALLSVEDEEFWSTPTEIKPLALGPLPALQQNVVVIGYPTGGDNTSVTSGVVSRVEVAQYVHSASHLMAAQIDAAVNPGNSGGPALQGDEVVGVAFQNLPNAENIGYIIPTPVVRHFLTEVARYGQYRGFCSLGIMCQSLENPHLRHALRMPPGATGVLINNVQQTSTAAQYIKKGDVLLEFNGVPIANDGTVHLRQRERIYFSYLITLQSTGQTARVKLLRDGQVIEESLVLQPNTMLVPVHMYDRLPSYFIYAGLVFVPLTQPYLMEYGEGGDWVNACPRRLYDKALHTIMSEPGQQIVVLSQVLVDDVNTGYQQLQNLQVKRVNGVPVLNLAHLRRLVATPTSDGFVRFECEDDRLIAVPAREAEEASLRVAERYRVPSLASPALLQDAAPSPSTGEHNNGTHAASKVHSTSG